MGKDKEMEEGADISLLARLMDDTNDDDVILFDENGDEIILEQIAVIPYEGQVFAILRPIDADEDSAAVFKIDTEDEESVNIIEDEALAEKILDIYHNQN